MQRKIDEVGISDIELIKKLEEKLANLENFLLGVSGMSYCKGCQRAVKLRKEISRLKNDEVRSKRQ